MSDSLKTLHIERGNLKARLTNFKKFVTSIDIDNVTESKIENLNTRLEKLYPLFERFGEIQHQIECLNTEDASEFEETELFENDYFESVSIGKQIIKRYNINLKSTDAIAEKSQGSYGEEAASHNAAVLTNVNLPVINLPTFDGTFSLWREYCDAFTSLIHTNANITNGRKLNYLKSSLTGEPSDLLRPLEITDENYPIAWDKLKKKYDNKRKIIYNHVRTLLDLSPVTKDSVQSLQKFINTIETHIECLKSWNLPINEWDALIVPILCDKLDLQTNKEWESRINKGVSSRERIPTLSEMLDFLNDKVNMLDAISKKCCDSYKGSFNNKHKTNKTFATMNNYQCTICNANHTINLCEKFLEMSTEERNKKVKMLKLCINCLKKGHFIQHCQSKNTCKICQKRHNTLLHHSSSKPLLSSEAPNQTTANYSSRTSSDTYVVLSTAKVHAKDNKNKLHQIRVLLDSASQSHFITEDTCKLLNLKRQNININVTGLNKGNLNITQQAQVEIGSTINNYKQTITCLIVPQITNMLPTYTLDIKDFQIPPNIKLADPNFYKPGPINILIGADLFWELLCVGQIKNVNKPLLQKTKLGWVVSGTLGITYQRKTRETTSNQTFFSMDALQETVERFWKMDEFKENKKQYTPEEQYCLDFFNETTERDQEGRFVVKLPLKRNMEELGNSFEVAKTRFLSLERRFKTNTTLKSMYTACIEDYIDQDHMSTSNKETKCFYLPHHAVFKESSQTTKLRVVFDGSCKIDKGVPINQLQYVGPTLQNDLFSILTRFRTHKYVLTGDIAQMYRQIVVNKEDRKYQKILWRKNENEQLQAYELNRVTFGMTSAPFLAIRCILQLAMEFENVFPIEAKIIKEDFYVDDLITSHDDVEQLKTIKNNIVKILKSAGFQLRKFNSNIEELRDEKQAHSKSELADESFKTLGIQWNPNSDMLAYTDIEIYHSKVITKRAILAQTAKLFDPLGLIAPIIVSAKIILQELWQAKLGWDETISIKLHTKWRKFENELKEIHKIRIKRLTTVENPTWIELHTFVDASERAYGTCIYLKSSNSSDTEVNLIVAKSRVAPLKIITLPRLELCAAVIGAQLSNKFKSILNITINKEYYWTDSQVTLSWIKSQPNKYKTFVANRISEIQNTTDSKDWFHVNSQNNPADLISRGVLASNLINNNLWWHGPTWLQNNYYEWELQEQVSSDLPEQRKVERSFISTKEDYTPWFSIEHFSTFIKALRVMAYCQRFSYNIKHNKSKRLSGELTATELSQSCLQLVKIAQKVEFAEEIDKLSHNKHLHKKSNILNLAPFLDKHGILRVGGRLQLSQYSFDKKHPMLLPKSHHLTNIIVRHEHIQSLHSGPNQLLANVREKFWPIAGKNIAKKIVKQCIQCFRWRNTVQQQIMGQLPLQRTAVTPPFFSTGIDYTGPFILRDREGRGFKTYKAYISLFVCMSTKAIHLELVSNLTTNAFIATLRRFVARRGKPLHIFSDNGTNFIGAKNELADLYIFLENENDNIQSHLCNLGINWHFIPPHSPNFGGLWEAGVKSTKKHLRQVLTQTALTYENFNTILVQIESILNSRPLTPLNNDPNDSTPLTPGHFLIGRPITALPDPDLKEIKLGKLDKFQHIQSTIRTFWNQWKREYIHQLQVRTKWAQQGTPIKVNDLVLVKEENLPPAQWKLGRVIQLHKGQDGITRVVTIKGPKNDFKRPVNKICVLPVSSSAD